MYIHIHPYIHTYIHACTQTYMHAYTHTCIRAHTHTRVHKHTRVHTHTHTHTRVHTHTYLQQGPADNDVEGNKKQSHAAIHAPRLVAKKGPRNVVGPAVSCAHLCTVHLSCYAKDVRPNMQTCKHANMQTCFVAKHASLRQQSPFCAVCQGGRSYDPMIL